MNIQVYNLHEDKWEGKTEYIGRPSLLGNPWVVGKDGDRKRVIRLYREWLWEIIREGRRGEYGGRQSGRSALPVQKGLTKGVKECLREGDTGNRAWRALIWEELQLFLRRARAGERLNLVCYCKPLDCHGDVIRAALEWLAQQEEKQSGSAALPEKG